MAEQDPLPRAGADGEISQPEQQPSAADIAAELATTKDRLLRMLADQENIRSQARRDRDEAVRFAASGFAGDLLSSVDNLERAIASVPVAERSEPVVANLLQGVGATLRLLLDAFAKHGLVRLDPLGELFDPHQHEASFEEVDTQSSPGTVIQVIQPGYKQHDRLLRPALVGVSKSPNS